MKRSFWLLVPPPLMFVAAFFAGAQLDHAVPRGARAGRPGSVHRGSSPHAVTVERFNLHAGVTIRADDDVGRERLCRYLTRPAFALERIVVQKDGNVRYRVKKVSRHRATYRVMTPLEFILGPHRGINSIRFYDFMACSRRDTPCASASFRGRPRARARARRVARCPRG